MSRIDKIVLYLSLILGGSEKSISSLHWRVARLAAKDLGYPMPERDAFVEDILRPALEELNALLSSEAKS